jgi:hypothetical protein
MRALRLLLPVFYVLSSLPVQASYHYCLGRVKQISFYTVNDPHCVCPADAADFGECCDTEQSVLDFQDEHTTVDKSIFVPDVSQLRLSAFQYDLVNKGDGEACNYLLRAPPPHAGQTPLFITHCIFRL